MQKSFRRAVDRNLLRRRIRDVFRRNKSVWPERTDMVIVLSSGGAHAASSTLPSLAAAPDVSRPAAALEAPYNELEADMLSLGRKAGDLTRAARAPRAGRLQAGLPQAQPQQQPAQRCGRLLRSQAHCADGVAACSARPEQGPAASGERVYRSSDARRRDSPGSSRVAASDAVSRKP